MAEPNLTDRIEIVEQKVHILESLPPRMEAVALQIIQLRAEMSSEFSSMRDEMRGGEAQLWQEIRAADARLRQEIRAFHTGLREEMGTLETSLLEKIRADIRDGDEQTRTYMRVLHEEVISKLAALGEGR